MNAAQFEELERRLCLSINPVGAEALTPTHQEQIMSDPVVAMAGDASYITGITRDFGRLGRATITRYSPAGKQLGTYELHADLVSLAMDAAGDAVVAFHGGVTESERGTYFFLVSKDGVATEPVKVFKETIFTTDPAVSMDAQGNFFLAFLDNESDEDLTLHARAYNANGSPRGPDIVVARQQEPQLFELDIAAAEDGSSAILTYKSEPRLVYQPTLHLARLTPAGQITQLQSIPPDVDTSDVFIYPDNSFVIAYSTHDPDPFPAKWVETSFAQRYDAAGVARGAQIKIGSSVASQGVALGLIGLPDGSFAVTFNVPTTDYSIPAPVYLARYDAFDKLDSQGLINLGDITAIPTLATSGGGDIVAVYEKFNDVYARRFRADFLQDGSSLYVLGTAASNKITIEQDGSKIVATRDEVSERFDAAAVTALSIDGRAGDDTISNRTVLRSTLRGGDGRDSIHGGNGNDFLYGNAGNDILFGARGADRLAGNGGRDHLYGGGGNDRLFSGASGDWLYSQGGNDQLFGQGGNDRIYADYPSGSSTLHGGTGDDLLVSKDATLDHLFGDAGHDSALADDNDVLSAIEVTSI